MLPYGPNCKNLGPSFKSYNEFLRNKQLCEFGQGVSQQQLFKENFSINCKHFINLSNYCSTLDYFKIMTCCQAHYFDPNFLRYEPHYTELRFQTKSHKNAANCYQNGYYFAPGFSILINHRGRTSFLNAQSQV